MIGLRTALGVLVGVGVGACFSAPTGDVLFSCDPDDETDAVCPPGYECRADGCCHDVDTEEGTAENACRLAPEGGTAGTSGTASDTATTGGSGSTDGSAGTDTGTSTDASTGGTTDGSTTAVGDASETGVSSSSEAGTGTSTTGT